MDSFGIHQRIPAHVLQGKIGMDFLVLFVMEEDFGIQV
jgi:hypothetical protein